MLKSYLNLAVHGRPYWKTSETMKKHGNVGKISKPLNRKKTNHAAIQSN
jgi:hypothetical protein